MGFKMMVGRLYNAGVKVTTLKIDEFLLRLLALWREGKPPAAMVAELRISPTSPSSPHRSPGWSANSSGMACWCRWLRSEGNRGGAREP